MNNNIHSSKCHEIFEVVGNKTKFGGFDLRDICVLHFTLILEIVSFHEFMIILQFLMHGR